MLALLPAVLLEMVSAWSGEIHPTILCIAFQAGLAVVGVAALLYFGRKTASSLANNLRKGIVNLGKLAAFWAVVVFAAKYVIEH